MGFFVNKNDDAAGGGAAQTTGTKRGMDHGPLNYGSGSGHMIQRSDIPGQKAQNAQASEQTVKASPAVVKTDVSPPAAAPAAVAAPPSAPAVDSNKVGILLNTSMTNKARDSSLSRESENTQRKCQLDLAIPGLKAEFSKHNFSTLEGKLGMRSHCILEQVSRLAGTVEERLVGTVERNLNEFQQISTLPKALSLGKPANPHHSIFFSLSTKDAGISIISIILKHIE